ncbi:membrane protein of uknown function UCP014873 [Methylorubrum extorquens PA1]|nr:membrane protein of uknown function UCP014873 [Methylorubrum extorquens PA1]
MGRSGSAALGNPRQHVFIEEDWMAELVVIGFEDPQEADRALNELARLQTEYLIDLEDAVVAIRSPDGKLRLKQSVDLVGAGAASGGIWGAMWGSLVGLVFLNPLLGLATGAALGLGAGALSGKLADYGINDDFIRSVAEAVQPNTSALFILVRKAQPEKVLAEMSRFRGRVIRSSLSPEQESRLQAALSQPDVSMPGSDGASAEPSAGSTGAPASGGGGAPPPGGSGPADGA